MGNVIVLGIVVLMVGTAMIHIWKNRKRGTKCNDCLSAGYCNKKNCK